MIDTIKQFHKEHGYYPNRVQLGKMFKLDRRTIDARLQKLKEEGVIADAPAKTIIAGNYTLIK